MRLVMVAVENYHDGSCSRRDGLFNAPRNLGIDRRPREEFDSRMCKVRMLLDIHCDHAARAEKVEEICVEKSRAPFMCSSLDQNRGPQFGDRLLNHPEI